MDAKSADLIPQGHRDEEDKQVMHSAAGFMQAAKNSLFSVTLCLFGEDVSE